MLKLEGVRVAQGTFSLSAQFTIEPGSRVSVLGPSGSGKSTLLLAIGGFVSPAAGRILWGDQDLTCLPAAARPISILFQDNNLFPHLTAAQNVGLGLQPSLRLSKTERERVDATLEAVGLTAFGARKPSALSGGQQSRVALARVLLREKPLLLLDEPFAALGPGLRAEMLDLVMQIAEDTNQTILMVTHDTRDAEHLGGQSIFVESGRASAPVCTADLLDTPPEALRRYLAK